MFVRSTRFAVACVLGFVASASLASCGGGGGGAGTGSAQLVTLLTTTIPGATSGAPYTTQFTADFPNAPGRFLVTGGALPPGLVLDSQTGLLVGYARQTGVFSFRIAARDGVDLSLPPNRDATFAQDTGNFQMVVALGPPNILPQQPPAAQYRASYGYQIDVAGGTAPYVFQQIGGALPTGLTVSTSGLLGNFPQQETADGSPYQFTVRVTDANNQTDIAVLTVDVVVLPLIILTTSPLPQAAAGFAYSVPLQLASAGAGAPITWTQPVNGMGQPIDETGAVAVGDVLLSTLGMEVTAAGILRHASPNPGPTAVGTYQFHLRVTDEAGQAAWRAYSIKINAGPVLNSITPNKAVAIPPTFVLTGLNFQPGAVVIFKPGVNQIQANPSGNTPTQLTLNSAPATPAGGGGFVTVRVLNPDGGFSDLPNAFAFPAASLTFNGTPTFPSPNSSLSSTGLAVGDLNKDGFADIVHVGSQNNFNYDNGANPTAGGVHVMLNTPAAGVFNGTFAQVVLNTGGDIQGVRLSDVDSDGDLDIVVVGRIGGSLRVRCWRNPYPAAFTNGTLALDSTPAYDPGYNSSGIDLGRISPVDAVPDVVYTISDQITNGGSSTTWTGGSYQTLQGAGNGTFNTSIETNTAIPAIYSAGDVALADFDGDGRSDPFFGDLVGGYMGYNNFAGSVVGQQGSAALTNPSTGLFGSWTPVGGNSGLNYTLGIAAGDVNGDGRPDVVAAATEAWQFGGGTAGLGVYQGSGTGSFSSVTPGTGSGRPRYAAIFDADFDFPGDVAVSVATNKIDIYKGRTGSLGLQFRQALTITGTPKVGRVATGDFNNDGRVDVCGTLSFYAVDAFGNFAANENGNGSSLGVVLFLNTSN